MASNKFRQPFSTPTCRPKQRRAQFKLVRPLPSPINCAKRCTGSGQFHTRARNSASIPKCVGIFDERGSSERSLHQRAYASPIVGLKMTFRGCPAPAGGVFQRNAVTKPVTLQSHRRSSAFDPTQLLLTASSLGIFLITFAESGLLLGFFLPGDSLLLTAGILAQQGKLHLARHGRRRAGRSDR